MPVGLEERIRAEPTRLVGIVERRVEQHRDREVVAPPLARLLAAGQAVDPRAARQAVRNAMAVLVDDDPVLQVSVADARVIRMLANRSGRRSGRDGGPDRVPVGLRDARDGDRRRSRRQRARQDGSGAAAVEGDDERFRSGRARLPCLLDVLTAEVAAGHDRDPVAGRSARVVRGRAAVAGVDEPTGRSCRGRSRREACP